MNKIPLLPALQRSLGVALGLACLLAAGGTALAADAACPAMPLRIAFNERPMGPFLRGEGPRFAAPNPGHVVDELRLTLNRLGCKAQLLRLPQRRMIAALTAGEIDFAIGLAASTERLALWRFPEDRQGQADRRMALALSAVHWVVLGSRRQELEPAWQSGRLAGRLGAVPSSGPEQLAQAAGIAVQPVETLDKALALLALRRFDAVALPIEAFDDELRDGGAKLAPLQPALGSLAYYAPASRRFYEQDAAFTRRFWSALCDEARKRTIAPGCRDG